MKTENTKTKLSTRDILIKITEIQMKKIEKYNSSYKNKGITKESELAMQNMIEILKLRYEIFHKSNNKKN